MLQRPDPHGIGETVAALLGCAVGSVTQIRDGRNNQIFRVTAGDQTYAAKRYPAAPSHGYDRMDTEYGALAFLRSQGIDAVPQPVARSETARVAVYEWIDGGKPDARQRSADDISAFFVNLLPLKAAAAKAGIHGASACCFSLNETLAQLKSRGELLGRSGEESVEKFLRAFDRVASLAVTRAEAGMRTAGLDPSVPLADQARCLSPSDFGFHNALRRADGTVVFLDFEYFGWDDPVKAVADILLHPGMDLSEDEGREVFSAVAGPLSDEDRTFRARFELLHPIYALIWCLIVLNEFVPDYAARRAAAGAFEGGKAEFLAQQLAKAHHRLDKVAHDIEHRIAAAS